MMHPRKNALERYHCLIRDGEHAFYCSFEGFAKYLIMRPTHQ